MFMSSLMISDAGNDEIKIFEYDKHEDDNSDRLSPVIKDEEVRKTAFTKLNHRFSIYFSYQWV